MMSMLETLAGQKSDKNIHFLHACENAQQHSFYDRLETLNHYMPGLRLHTWYQNPLKPVQAGQKSGLMNLSDPEISLTPDGHYYLCGPVNFMAFAKSQLLEQGINSEQIHYEVFGPHESLN